MYRIIYPDKHQEEVMFEAPDYEYIHKELKKPGVTLKLYRGWSIKTKINEAINYF